MSLFLRFKRLFTVCFSIALFSLSTNVAAQYITTWKTDNAGVTGSNQIKIPATKIINPTPALEYAVSWQEVGNPGNNGTVTGLSDTYILTFPTPGKYRVSISGFYPGGGFYGSDDALKIISIDQWGTNAWSYLFRAYQGCANLVNNATDSPNLSSVTSLQSTFQGASLWNGDMSGWNVSNVYDLSYMFYGATSFNGNVTTWNTSNVTDMQSMFYSCPAFNQNIGSWNTSKVTNFHFMFSFCDVFNQNLNNWDVSKVTDMGYMFQFAKDFNSPLNNWDVSKVTTMPVMFSGTKFNQPIGNWDVSKVTNMYSMFAYTPINQDLSLWNTGNVTDMGSMFSICAAFNQNISAWNTSKVTRMTQMFDGASSFNQNISSWNVGLVTDMQSMFRNATAFNQNLASWNVGSVTTMVNMFNGTALSNTNYDNILIGWAALSTLQTGVHLDASGKQYCYGKQARNYLTSSKGWVITDGGEYCTFPTITNITTSGDVGGIVRIDGQNFDPSLGNNLVYFGSVSATPYINNSSYLYVIVPTGTTYGPITVVDKINGLSAISSQNFDPTYSPRKTTISTFDFNPKVDFTTGANAWNASITDFDQDGKPDLAVANYVANNVSVFRNISSAGNITSASFAAKVDYTTGNGPLQAITGDIDGDGKKDLVTINNGSNSISIFLNTSTSGAIMFAPKVDIIGITGGVKLVIRDLDGDGKADLAVVANSPDALYFLRNKSTVGTIAFDAPFSYGTGAQPTMITATDLDNDNLADLVVVNGTSNTASVFKNTSYPGVIQFNLKVDFATGASPRDVVVGDIDGDGKQDIAVVNGNAASLSILRNTTTTGVINASSFAARVNFTTGTSPNGIAIADINGDNKPDLITSNQGSSTVSVFKNTATSGSITIASLTAKVDLATAAGPTGITVSDLDGDNMPEIVTANTTAGSMSVIRNNPFFPPVISGFTPSNGATGSSVTITGTSLTGATSVTIGGAAATITANTATSITITVGAGATGVITVVNPGGTTSSSGIFTFVPPPTITNFTPTTGGNGTVITITGTNFLGVSSVHINGIAVDSYTEVSTTTITAVVPITTTGPVSVTTPGGTASFGTFVFDPRPTIASFIPTSAANGTTVTITGTNFIGTTAVSFGGTAASSFTVASPTTITAVVATGSTGLVAVQNASGSASAGGFTFLPPPTVGSFTPTVGPSGTVITISGTLFTGATDVKIGNTAATSFTVINATTITATVGSGATGPISVTTAGGTGVSSSSFIFSALPPTITSFTPASGNPGLSVTITGTNFNPIASNNVVYFGATRATVTAATTTSITVTVPVGATYSYISELNSAAGLIAYSNKKFYPRYPSAVPGITVAQFGPKVDFNSGSNTQDVEIADFDGDGKSDMAAAAYVDNQISIFRSAAFPGTINSGSFITQSPISVANANGVASGDIDGDGKLDLITSSYNNSQASVFLNTSTVGNISFASAVDLYYTNPGSLTVIDVDGDGKAEIIVSAFSSIHVFQNTSTIGNVSFAGADFDYNTGNPAGISVGDLDLDGKPDLVAAVTGGNTVTVFHNSSSFGSIGFEAPVDFIISASPSQPNGVEIGDLDGDGKYEIVVANNSSAQGVAVLKNTSIAGSITSGSFAAFVTLPYPAQGASVAMGDFDSDGKLDFVEAGTLTRVFRNEISGTINPASFSVNDLSSSTYNGRVKVADMDGDGISDIIVADVFNNQVSIYRNNPTIPPVIASFTPTSGVTGTTVTITGTSFLNTSSVKFGGTDAASFTVVSSTTITADVAEGSTGNVAVTTPNGTDSKSGFTYYGDPTIDSFDPMTGTTGTVVTVLGSNFTGATSVTVGGVAATSFTVVDSGTITLVVGNGASGDIVVTTPAGDVSSSGFVFYVIPKINSFTPVSGIAGTTVTITGQNFNPVAANNKVYFGGLAATVNSGTATSLNVTIPLGASSVAPFIVRDITTGLQANSISTIVGSNVRQFTVTATGISNINYNQQTVVLSYGNIQTVVTGDFNNDGNQDFITDHYNNFVLTVNLGDGAGNFTPMADISVGKVSHTSAADLNGDGNLDLVFEDNNTYSVQLTLGNGDGTFGSLTDVYSNSDYIITTETGDFNNDGLIDIVLSDYGKLTVLLNDGIGNFTDVVTPVVNARNVSSIGVGDFNNDGKADLALANSDGGVSVRLGNGDGTFSSTPDYSIAEGPYSITIGDFNADGKPDFAVVDVVNNYVSIAIGDGTGLFPTFNGITLPSWSQSITIGDFNGDGFSDLAAVLFDANNVSVSLGNGDGTFSATPLTFPNGSSSSQIATADFNKDGKADLITGNYNSSNVSILYYTPPPVITSISPVSGPPGTTVTITGSGFNPGSGNDVSFGGVKVLGTSNPSGTVVIVNVPAGATSITPVTLKNNANNFSASSLTSSTPLFDVTTSPALALETGNYAQSDHFVFNPKAVAARDFNNDGFVDFVGAGVNGEIRPYRNDGSGGFGGTSNPTFAGMSKLLSEDLNGDGLIDLIGVSSDAAPADIILIQNTGFFNFNGFGDVPAGISGDGGDAALADINNDGRVDLISTDGGDNLSILTGDGAGNFVHITTSPYTIIGNGFGGISAADFNKDGFIDIAVASNTANQFYYFKNNKDGTFAAQLTIEVSGNTTPIIALVSGYFDGDAILDIATLGTSEIAILKGDGIGGFTEFAGSPVAVDGFPQGITIGDFDGDGKTDLAASGYLSLFKGDGAGGFTIFSNFPYGLPNTWGIVTADFNNDGKADLATADFLSGQITILQYHSLVPTVTSFTPTSGATGDVITINGTNFDGPTSVTFGGVAATINSISSNVITATIGAGASGSVDVTTAYGTGSLSGFTYIPTPTITSFTPTSEGYGATVTITGTNLLDATSVQFGSINALSFTVVSATSITAVVAGGTTGNVTVVTPGGTATKAGFTFLPPIITTFSPGSATQGTTVTITGTNLLGAFSVNFGSTLATSFSVVSSTSITAVVGNGASGNVQVITPGGTATSASSFNFIGGPTITSFTPSAGTGQTITINGTNLSAATSVTLGGTTATILTNNATTITATVGAGTTGLVQVVNAGGVATSATNFTYIPTPTITTFTPSAGTGQTVTITGTNLSGATSVKLGGTAAAILTNTATQITVTVGAGTTGLVQVVNPGGTATSATNFTYVPTPTITSFTPSAGTGQTVTINGTNLSGATSVTLGGTAAAILTNTATQITVTVGAGTTGFVQVVNPGGTATSASNFTYIPTPTITSFTPAFAGYGETVTITGTNFTSASAFTFGGTNALSYLVVSATSITAVVGIGTSGSVLVTTPGGTGSKTGFTFSPPAISSFTPTTGASGSSVVVSGTGLLTATSATIGGTAAVIAANTATSVTLTVGTGSTGVIIINTPAGTATSAGTYTFIGAPTITSFTATSAGYSETVTITGTNFTGATAVSFGGTAALSYNIVSATSITAVVGIGTSGTVSITTPGGTGTKTGFTYLPSSISSFTPTTGASGSSVVVTGSALLNATSATIGGTTAVITANTATSVTLTVGSGTTGLIVITTPAGTATSSATYTFIPAPTITSFTPTNSGSGALITINGTDFTGASTVSFGGVTASSFTVISPTQITATVAGGGSGNVSVTTTGGTGVLAGYTFIGGPTITSFTPISAATGAIVTINGTNLSGTTAVSFGGTPAISFTNISATQITAVVGAGTSGIVSVTTSGGTNTLAGFTFIPAPTITSFTPTSAGTGLTVTINGTNLSGTTAVSFGGTPATSFTNISATQVTAVVAAGSSGSVSLTTAGGTASLGGFTFVPTPTITSFTPTSSGTGFTVTINGTNLSGTTAVSFGGTTATSFTNISATQVTAVVAAGTSGSVSLATAGGTASLAGFTFVPTPTITSFTPTSSGSGALITINGTDFTGASTVSFGGVAASSFTVISPTQITATVGGGGSGNVSVTTAGGTGVLAGYTFIGGPTITSFTPISAATGATVTITGTNLSGTTAVSFGGTAATSFTNISATQITAVVSTGASGSVSITTGGGTNTLAGFTYIPAPTITSFTPSAGTGQTVTINGTNLTGVSAVSFGGTSAASFNFISATQITAIVAAGSSGLVSLTTPGGTATSSGFTYIDPPTIVSITPTSSGAGATITINGTFLTGVSAVSFGGVAAASFNFVSPTQITAIVGAGGTGNVDVTTPGGTATFAGYTFIGGPTISNFTPTSAATGATITINGSNLTGVSAVSLGGTPATSFSFISATQITAVVAAGSSGLVSVTTPGGTTTSAGFTYIAPPTIVSFSPTTAATGATVTIDGTNFTGVSAVSFGGTPATSFNFISATQITAVVAAGSSGIVSVTTPGGTTTSPGFTYIAPPTIVSFTPTTAATGATVTIDGTNFTGVSAVSFGGTPATSFNFISATQITAVVAAGSSGLVSVTTPGGTATTPGFTFFTGPVISSFSPASAANGDTVTITGTNLSGVTAVSFGGTPANSFTPVSATTITAVVSTGASGSVSVITPTGTGTLAGFIFIPSATITSFAPTSASSGTTVTITGTNLTGITGVSFGGTAATSFISVSPTTITAVVGAGASGNITVITSSGPITSGGFVFIPNPVITSFSPINAATGTTVTIKGTGLSGATAVSFGGTPATSFTSVSSTTVTAVVGNGATGIVYVTTPGGTATLGGFTHIPAPVITSFTPVNAAAGTTVIITGTNLGGTNAVTFGGTPAASFISVSATSISAVVGSGSSGNISITASGGTASAPGFTFLPVPTIVSFNPTSAASGTVVTITGTNLSGITGVDFGGSPAASFTSVSATTMTAVVGNGSSGNVTVSTVGGTATKTGFTFIPAPSIASFTPSSGGSGGIITITGTNLLATSSISFGGTPAASFNIVSATSVTAVIGSGSSGNVSVTTAGGTSVRGGFTFIATAAMPVVKDGDNNSGNVVSSVAGEVIYIGETFAGQDLFKTFSIENIGNSIAEVVSVTTDNRFFTVIEQPATIAPNSFERLVIKLNSNQPGIQNARVTIQYKTGSFDFGIMGELKDPSIFVYNAVTPNGDGAQDFLKISNIDLYPSNKVTIINRLGDPVFKIENYSNTESSRRFEGLSNIGSNQNLTDGTYFYIIDLGNKNTSTGFLLLQR